MTLTYPAPGTAFGTAGLAIAVILGLLSLFFGRQLFYVFVALVGFGVGFAIGQALFGASAAPGRFAPATGGWLPLVIGIVIGIIAALLAVVLQRPLAAISAFLIVFAAVRQISAAAPGTASLVLSVVLGIVALVLVWIFFDWGLVVISALAGAAALTEVVRTLTVLPSFAALLIFVVLAVVGIAFQSRALHGKSV